MSEDIILTNIESITDLVISTQKYNPKLVEVVHNRNEVFLKYKRQRVGAFFINRLKKKVSYQHEIPHKQ